MKKLLCVLAIAGMATPAMGQVFWASARGVDAVPPHQIHSFDMNGVLMNSVDQVAGAQSSAWGYRDGAFDGTFMYFGWEGGVARHNIDGSGGTQIIFGGAPVGTWRALAFDPTGDGGRGSLWTANFGSDIVEVNLSGGLLTTLTWDQSWSLYGLSYDDTTGDLWGHSGGGDIINIDTTTGVATTVYTTPFTNGASQGGMSGFSELGGNLAAVMQGAPDMGGVIDLGTGGFAAGPWDWEGETGSNGHLGVAVVPGPGALALLGLGALASRRRRRR